MLAVPAFASRPGQRDQVAGPRRRRVAGEIVHDQVGRGDARSAVSRCWSRAVPAGLFSTIWPAVSVVTVNSIRPLPLLPAGQVRCDAAIARGRRRRGRRASSRRRARSMVNSVAPLVRLRTRRVPSRSPRGGVALVAGVPGHRHDVSGSHPTAGAGVRSVTIRSG